MIIATRNRRVTRAKNALLDIFSNRVVVEAGVIEGQSQDYPAIRPDGVVRGPDNRRITKIAGILLAMGFNWFEVARVNNQAELTNLVVSTQRRHIRSPASGSLLTSYQVIENSMVDSLKMGISTIQMPMISSDWVRYKARYGGRTDILRWSDHLLNNQVARTTVVSRSGISRAASRLRMVLR